MKSCWQPNPKKRPAFQEVHNELARILATVSPVGASSVGGQASSSLHITEDGQLIHDQMRKGVKIPKTLEDKKPEKKSSPGGVLSRLRKSGKS